MRHLVAAFGVAAAVPVVPARSTPEAHAGTAAPGAREKLVRALQSLVVAEEAHYSGHGTYTTDIVALNFRPPAADSVLVQELFAGGRGWTGMSTSRGENTGSCVRHVGAPEYLMGVPATLTQKRRPTEEAVAMCDDG